VKKNPKTADDIKSLLDLTQGVKSTQFNLTTGSILIYYHPDQLQRSDLIELLSDKGYFDMSKAVTNDQVIKSAAEGTIKFLSQSVVSDLVFALI
jgi:hypothetical protein